MASIERGYGGGARSLAMSATLRDGNETNRWLQSRALAQDLPELVAVNIEQIDLHECDRRENSSAIASAPSRMRKASVMLGAALTHWCSSRGDRWPAYA